MKYFSTACQGRFSYRVWMEKIHGGETVAVNINLVYKKPKPYTIAVDNLSNPPSAQTFPSNVEKKDSQSDFTQQSSGGECLGFEIEPLPPLLL